MKKLMELRTVLSKKDIPGHDLEVVFAGPNQIVTEKMKFLVGDQALFVHPNTFIPFIPQFEDLRKDYWDEKHKGFLIKEIFKGGYCSEGALIKIKEKDKFFDDLLHIFLFKALRDLYTPNEPDKLLSVEEILGMKEYKLDEGKYFIDQKVTCTNDDPFFQMPNLSQALDFMGVKLDKDKFAKIFRENGLKFGEVYTVMEITYFSDGTPQFLYMKEIPTVPYYPERFKPLTQRTTDISIFGDMLKKVYTEEEIAELTKDDE